MSHYVRCFTWSLGLCYTLVTKQMEDDMYRSRRLMRRHFLKIGLQGGLAFLAVGPIRHRSRAQVIHGTPDNRLQRILKKYGGEFGATSSGAREDGHVCV